MPIAFPLNFGDKFIFTRFQQLLPFVFVFFLFLSSFINFSMTMKNFFMRYLLLILGVLPYWMMGQNPLKKELKGSNTSVYYAPSNFNFTSYNNQSVLVSDINDNRSANWNKQINDSIRIDLIRDFWSYPYKTLFKNKVNQDFSKAKIKVDLAPVGGQYVIEPTVDAHFPNYVSYPKKGYYVYTKVNMKVSKNGVVQFNKAYQDYYFFTKGHPNFTDDFTKDFHEGTNVAMWIGMRNILDKFYFDLNEIFAGKQVASDNTPLTMKAIESNIADDKNLNSQQKSYTEAKDKKVDGSQVANNYKMDEPAALPTPSNDNLDKAIGSVEKGASLTPSKTLSAASKTPVKLDSTALAIRAQKEQLRRKAIDSAQKAKAELMKSGKSISSTDKSRRDSLLKLNQLAVAEKLKEKHRLDSAKKAEVNQKIEIAKQKREEEKKKLNPQSSVNTYASAPASTNQNKGSNRSSSISEEIKRIAREVEEEENRGGGSKINVSSRPQPVAKPTIDIEAIKKEREAKLATLKAEREAKLAALKAEADKKAAAFKAEKEAKLAKEEAEKKAQLAKIEEMKKAQLAVMTAKKYVEDSVKLEEAKRKKREAILAAQRAAVEAERNELAKNPNAAQLFAAVSTDPPSKLPETRTREQILADRIFTPKNDVSKNLLARVKLITPEEEMRMLSQLKSSELSSVDSVFIEYQKTRPMPAPVSDSAPAKKPTESTKDKSTGKKSTDKKAKATDKKLEVKADTKTAEVKTEAAKVENAKGTPKSAEVKKEEIKKSIVENNLKTPAVSDAAKVETPKVDATKAAEKTATEVKIERMDDDIRKKAEALKKKAQEGVR